MVREGWSDGLIARPHLADYGPATDRGGRASEADMIIWGWYRRPIVLGLKTDLCGTCGQATQHAILRITTWGHIFWVPFLLTSIRHRLVCTVCATERKLGWRQVREALRSGRLPIPARAGFKAWANGVFEETGRIPNEAAFDPIEPNPKRGPWNVWLSFWPFVVAGVVAYAIVVGGNRPAPPVPAANTPLVQVHDCYEATDGTINGCRMSDGTMNGVGVGTLIKCYFAEPLPTAATRLYCP